MICVLQYELTTLSSSSFGHHVFDPLYPLLPPSHPHSPLVATMLLTTLRLFFMLDVDGHLRTFALVFPLSTKQLCQNICTS